MSWVQEKVLNPIEVDLPMLMPLQQENVRMIEERFKVGKGRMITDGTGTGKTFTGLGVAKRFFLQGKSNILIVTPTDDKCKDWIKEGERVGVYIMQLDGVDDIGFDIRTTTYSNFYQNEKIPKEIFDLIIYDESHYIMQNGKGYVTSCFDKHKLMVSLPTRWFRRGEYFFGPPPYDPKGPNDLNEQQSREMFEHRNNCENMGRRIYETTKVLYLSATPFAYVKSIEYGDGTLWDVQDYPGYKHTYLGYNQPVGFDKFLCENFGYHMKNGKVTKPDADVDTGILEREFFEKQKELNVISTNMLDVPFDYSRHFIKVDSELGLKMDEFIGLIYSINDKRFERLQKVFRKHLSYIMVSKILESGKAENIIERLHWHLMLERKIVLFHGFNNVSIAHPFYVQDCSKYLEKEEKHWAYGTNGLNNILKNFYEAYPEWKEYDLSNLKSVPEIIKEHYGDRCVIYNGTVSKGQRRKRKDKFMENNSGVDIIVIQSQAGKEGISLHDVDGERQRVMIDLSLPVRPTEAIQKEGRTYRHGVKSNAIYEYPTLQTNMERMVFAYTIASRSKTVENLAMGNLARDLETAFKQGYENFEEGPPNIVQGREGKQEDKKVIYNISSFDKSITYYHQRQKANSKRNIHRDFYATPEPIGYKMVDWCNTEENLRWLEPSCGDGSIARFFPKNCVAKMLDIDFGLLGIAKLKSDAQAYHEDFMEYSINNKFDRVVMNPPFGHGGKKAIEHLLKALIHLNKRGNAKLYAIIPCGPSADKHFNRMVNSENMKFFDYTGDILLPAITFKKASTTVMTRIVRFEGPDCAQAWQRVDYTHIKDIKELFEKFETLNF